MKIERITTSVYKDFGDLAEGSVFYLKSRIGNAVYFKTATTIIDEWGNEYNAVNLEIGEVEGFPDDEAVYPLPNAKIIC